MNNGSLDSLKVSTRCGLSPNARQIRPTVDRDSPASAAIDARDQWVASLGVRSSVATRTCSICSSLMLRGPPGRGSSSSPSSRFATNRRRHLPTVASAHPSFAATDLLSKPSAHDSTILDRNANACDDVARRDHRSNCPRSSRASESAALGRPVLGIPQSRTYLPNSRRRTLVLRVRSGLTVGFVEDFLGGLGPHEWVA